MADIAGIVIGGTPLQATNGVVVKLWLPSQFMSGLPSLDGAEPGVPLSVCTTSQSFGSIGAYKFTGLYPGIYYLDYNLAGHTYWWEQTASSSLESVFSANSNATLTNAGYYVCNAAGGFFVLTLPTPVPGMSFSFKKVDVSENSVTIQPTSIGEPIDGQPDFLLVSQYQFIRVNTDGTNWWIS